jgi:hypothetical protein
MASTISVYDQTAQPRMLLIEDTRPKLLQERYFPTNEPEDLFDAKKVTLDFDNGDFESGAFVSMGYVDGNTTTYFATAVQPPRVGVSDTIDTADKDRILFESLCRNDLSPSHADAQDALLRIKAARCVNRASRSIERLCVMALSNNAIQFTMDKSPTDSTQVTVDVEYFDSTGGATNPQSYIPTVDWGGVGATPHDDICAMVTTLVQHGGRAEDLLMSEKAWSYLYADMNTKGLLNSQIHYTNIANGDVRGLFSEEIEGAKCVGAAQFNGHVLNLIVYNGGYKASNGTWSNYLPDNFVCVLAPNCGRTLCGASSLPNPAAMLNGGAADIKQIVGKYLVYKYYDFQNEQVAVRCASNPLPSPMSAWRWITLGVASA